jgi:signal transduction histidine kinase
MRPAAKKKSNSTETSKARLKDFDPESHHQAKLEALSALIKISTAIGSMPMDLKVSLQFLVDETKKLFGLYGCAVLLLGVDANPKIIFSGPHDMGDGLLKDFKNTQRCLVVRDELPFIVQDTSGKNKKCRGFEFDRRAQSYACLPISTGKKLVGILVISSLQRQAFAQYHLEMMLSVASMAASLIQREQLIHELKEAQEQILQKEKLALAGRLAAGVAHEVNNPIGIIINRIECLQSESQEKGLAVDLIKDLSIINRHAHKISKIVEDLSIFSRTTYSESDFSRIDINDVLTDVLFFVEQETRGKKLKLIKKLYPESLFVMGDSGRLEQVFINIFDNAIDAISGNGSITASTRAGNKCIQIEISDSGTGIPEEHLNLIFDPFFTTKEVGKGTGLGLTISRAIIMDHNASIGVDSQINQGTTFTITFPMAPELNNEQS